MAAIKLILVTWNAAGYLRLSENKKQNMENEIWEAYTASKKHLKKLENKKLANIGSVSLDRS